MNGRRVAAGQEEEKLKREDAGKAGSLRVATSTSS